MTEAEGMALRRALQSVLGVGLGGLGVGAGARGIVGLRNLFTGGRDMVQRSAPVPTLLPVPVPQRPDEEKAPLSRAAATITKEAVRAGLNWWQIPASATLGAGGVAGGWELMDRILDSRRRAELDQELSDAQTEYEEALQARYEQALQKRGALDDVFEKLAGEEDTLSRLWRYLTDNDPAQGAMGLYATGLAATTGAGALGGYHWARSRGRRAQLEEALRRRKRMSAGQPEPLYAYPTSLPRTSKAQEEEEQELL
jgi:hypothetical protein